jgi:agmatinase
MKPSEPRTDLPSGRRTPRFAGITTFCRFPRLEDVPPARRPVDWAIYGVPFDSGVTYRPGARFGPRAIREASQYMKPVNLALSVNLVEAFSLADAGDAPVRAFSCAENLDSVATFARTLGDAAHTRLFAVGGDHSIALANLRATWERRGRPRRGLAIIHFDAHLDTVDEVWGERQSHASPFRRAIEEGLINPSRMLSIGVRGPLNSADDLAFGRDAGITLVTFDDWKHRDGVKRVEAFLRQIRRDEAYVTFDIDCIDPAFAPGTGTPCCGGFTSAEAIHLVRALAGVNMVGADVVEVLPDRDPAGITSLLASHVMIEILAAAAVGAAAGSVGKPPRIPRSRR